MFSWLLWFSICVGMGWNPYQAYENPTTGQVQFHQRTDTGTNIAVAQHR